LAPLSRRKSLSVAAQQGCRRRRRCSGRIAVVAAAAEAELDVQLGARALQLVQPVAEAAQEGRLRMRVARWCAYSGATLPTG
jgi:hypothetical protein